MKKILLTGGSGFIGSHIQKMLGKRYIVSAPTRSELDVRNREAVIQYVSNGDFDVIVHAASPSPVRSADKDTYENLFRDMLKIFMNFYAVHEKCDKLIYCGSGAEYSKNRDICKVTEEQVGMHIPPDEYGLGKYIMNDLARGSSNIYNLRIFACFGPGEYSTKFITHAIRCCLNKQPITIRQDCYFDYLYIEDYVKFVSCFIDKENVKYHDYNACSGKRIKLSDIAKKVKEQMGAEQPVIIAKSGMNYEYTASNKRILKECNISEKDLMDIDSGISKLIAWERENYKCNVE